MFPLLVFFTMSVPFSVRWLREVVYLVVPMHEAESLDLPKDFILAG